MRFLSQSSWINLNVTLLSNFQSSLSENMEFFWLDGGTVLLLIQLFCLSQLQKRNPRTILSTVCFHFSETKDKGKESKGKESLLEEIDNNYTCPRRPKEPDHVAMETQVQQKVTRKSIQIELISPLSLSFLISQGLQSMLPLWITFLTIAGLMQH